MSMPATQGTELAELARCARDTPAPNRLSRVQTSPPALHRLAGVQMSPESYAVLAELIRLQVEPAGIIEVLREARRFKRERI